LVKYVIYKSLNGHQYYFEHNKTPPNEFLAKDHEAWNAQFLNPSNCLSTLPKGYRIVERLDGLPYLVSKKHTMQVPNCQWEKILDLVNDCDLSWYIAAISSSHRASKEEFMIQAWISELENIEKTVSCPECQMTLKLQIKSQKLGFDL